MHAKQCQVCRHVVAQAGRLQAGRRQCVLELSFLLYRQCFCSVYRQEAAV